MEHMEYTDHRLFGALDVLAAGGTCNPSGVSRRVRGDVNAHQLACLRRALDVHVVRIDRTCTAPTVRRLMDLGYADGRWEMQGRRKVLVGFAINERGARRAGA